MLPDRVSNPGPLTYESGALPIVDPIRICTIIYAVSWGCGKRKACAMNEDSNAQDTDTWGQ